MGKASRRRQQKKSLSPFLLLMMWMKVYHAQGEHCACGASAEYANEHYVDMVHAAQLLSEGHSQSEATDVVWNKALKEQLQGTYTRALTTYHCHGCAFKLAATHAGEQAATLLFIPMMIAGDRMSLLLLNRLDTENDVAKPCAASISAKSIEEVARGLRQNAVPIHVNT
jgi:hypothetical protein